MTKQKPRDFQKGQVGSEGVELWWLCAELARFLASTDEMGFRQLWRGGERYKNAIEERMRKISKTIPGLDEAKCFLEYEGWGFAEKIWITGEGDDALALDTATCKLAEDCRTELRIGQSGLLAWRCKQAAQTFERSGKKLAQEIGSSFPPKTIKNKNVAALLQMMAQNSNPGLVAEKQYELPPLDRQAPEKGPSGRGEAEATDTSGKKKRRGKAIPDEVKTIVFKWLMDEYGGDLRGVGWKHAFDQFSASTAFTPRVRQFIDGRTKFCRVAKAARKEQKRRTMLGIGQKV